MKDGLQIIPVQTVDEVLGFALTETLTPIQWTEEDEAAMPPPPPTEEGDDEGGRSLFGRRH